MPLSQLRPSFTLTEDHLKGLQAIVPEPIADGKTNKKGEKNETTMGNVHVGKTPQV